MIFETAAADAAIRSVAERDASIGRILADMQKITAEDATRIVARQAELGLRFGEAAQELGLVSASDVQQALASQFDYQYVASGQSGFDPALVAAREPFGDEAEMLRGLRSQLSVRWFNGEHKALAVVAVDASTSAAVVSANLAIAFAQQGQRTVLVDANMRMPRQHALFGLQARTGLSDLLAGRTAAAGALPVAPFDRLALLCAGAQPPNPLELLGRDRFGALNSALVRDFDVVLYDAPAFSGSADAYAVAARAGGVLLVVGKRVARQAALREIRAQLLRSGVEIVGSILVDF